MKTTPYWFETAEEVSFPKLSTDLQVDVLVVGGGITGLTAGWLLLKAGKRVAIVERERVGHGDTGHTTAHLTQVTDMFLKDLVSDFGSDHGQAVWDAHEAAIDQLRAIVQELKIDCDLRSIPAFLVAAEDKEAERETLGEEAAMLHQLGFPGELIESGPITGRPAIRYANQWKFHPIKYLRGLARAFVDAGGQLFEETEAKVFQDEPTRVETSSGQTVIYDFLVLATHNPLVGHAGVLGATLFQTKLALYSTYAVQGRVASGTLPEMLWWDTADPYLYLRVDRGDTDDVVILGGEDHKTGQENDTEGRFARLEEKLQEMVPEVTLEKRWSGQVIESVDGLPYIGEVQKGQFLGTGYAGNGTSFGTLAGMMACDTIIFGKSPWSDLFALERKKLSATWDYLVENKDYPFYLAKRLLTHGKKTEIESLEPGQGALLHQDGHEVAACCDDDGVQHRLSPVCPHLGCIVGWNDAERTWDCPCHGSRFHPDGKVLSGPAESDLTPMKS